MLRLLVLLLLLANLGWWAWHWAPLAQGLGLAQDSEREPQRLARQVQADRIRLLPAPSEATASAPAAVASAVAADAAAVAGTEAALQCLEIGPLADTAYASTRRDLLQAGVAPDAWVDIRRERPGSFALYMGRFADVEQLRRKADELQRLGIAHEALGPNAPTTLAPGLTLGRYASLELAQARLQQLQARGVRTARVLTLTPPEAEHTLRLAQASGALQARLLPAGAASAAGGQAGAWRRCDGR
jgi:hypothetical protein